MSKSGCGKAPRVVSAINSAPAIAVRQALTFFIRLCVPKTPSNGNFNPFVAVDILSAAEPGCPAGRLLRDRSSAFCQNLPATQFPCTLATLRNLFIMQRLGKNHGGY